MKPPFRYYGGKGRLASWIVAMMPPHRSYIEPFFGAGAVLFAKPPAKNELVNDLDGMVVNFYRILRDRHADLVEVLRHTPYARDEYNACKTGYLDTDVDDLERARRFFVNVNMSFACTTGTASGFSSSMKQGTNRARTTTYYVDRLHKIADRLTHVMFENHDAVKIIDTHGDADQALIYCDPPYVHATRGDVARGGGHGYRCEMTDADHRNLAEALHNTPATVMLSGYHSELYDELYDGWHQASIDTYSTVAGINSRGNDRRTEVLWSNQPLLDGRLEFERTT
jgi:DNA adenine methylase